MSRTKPFKIAIVGGGLGGLALAIGLHRRGVPIHVYESAPEFSEIGAGLTFATNAIRALGLIDPDLVVGFRKHFKKNPPGFFMNIRFAVNPKPGNEGQNDYKMGDLLYELRDDEECGYIHRARLLEVMVGLLPPNLCSFRKTLVDIEELSRAEGDGVNLVFSDGTNAKADAVIGCDGIKSLTRAKIAGKEIPPRFTGDVVYRHMFPIETVVEALGEERAHVPHLLFSYGTVMVHYPVGDGSMVNMVAIHATGADEWEGGGDWVKPVSKEKVLGALKDWDPAILRLMSGMPDFKEWALFDCAHGEKYYRGRLCILGDAAHAATPHNGGGAGMAMEDAYALSQVISRVSNAHELEYAFEIYDSIRRQRTQRFVHNGRSSGKTWQLRDDYAKDVPSKLKEQLDAKFKWIWYHDLKAETDQALAQISFGKGASL